MGVAAHRNPNRQVVSQRQVSDTLQPSSSRQTQSSKTSYILPSVTETAATIKTTPSVSTNRLLALEPSTDLSSLVSPATSSSSKSSAVALCIVFGVFFGTIIFSFILWRLCRRHPTSKSSASWPSLAKATTAMPVRYSSTMRYPQRPTPVRIKSSDRGDRSVPSSDAEKAHSPVKVVHVIQPDVPPPMSQRQSHPVSRKGHRRDNSTPRLHPGRQAVVDVSSPTTETWDDKDVHRRERSRHDHNPTEPSLAGNRSARDPHGLPPVIFVAGRTAHERSSRRSREREQRDQHSTQSQSRARRSQPSIVNVVHESTPSVHATSISAPAVSTRYQQPSYDSPSTTSSTSDLSDNIGEQPPSLTTSSSSSSSSLEGRRSWTRTRPRSPSPQSPGRVRFTLPEGVRRYLDEH